MSHKNSLIGLGLIVVVAIAVYFFVPELSLKSPAMQNLDATPKDVTLSGTYTCLPHMDTTGPQTDECAFGLKADDGTYYAVNFGASANAMEQFQSGAHITAEGNVVIKEALNSDHWAKYNMKGIFTVTRMISAAPVEQAPQAKLNINVVCNSALTYMTFPDGKSSEKFLAECREGQHPEVIEHYKAQMNLGDGAAI